MYIITKTAVRPICFLSYFQGHKRFGSEASEHVPLKQMQMCIRKWTLIIFKIRDGKNQGPPKYPQSCARPASGPAGRRRGAGARLSCWLWSRLLRAQGVTCTLPAFLFLQQLSGLEKAFASTSALGLFGLWTHTQYVNVTESLFFQLFTVTHIES